LALPQQIATFAIEVENAGSFSEKCMPEVGQATPICDKMIIQGLNEGYNTGNCVGVRRITKHGQ